MLPNKKHRSILKGLLLGLVLVLVVAGCGKNDSNDNGGNSANGSSAGVIEEPGKVIAEYEGGQVTNGDLIAFLGAHKFFNYNEMYAYYEMMPNFQESMLHQLIAMRLIVDELPQDQKDESSEQAKNDIAQITESIESTEEGKEQYNELMNQLQIKTSDLENYMVSQYNLQKVFEAKYTDDEAKAKYDENLAENPNAYTVATVRHILVSTTDDTGAEVRTMEEALKRAQEVEAKLKNGGDWTALAAEYSDDPGSRDKGGQYEDVDVTQWVENFKLAALEQPVGQIGEPFETDFGYHVLLVEKRGVSDFELVKTQIKSELINTYFGNYIDVEVPKLITKLDLPQADAGADAEDAEGAGDAEGTEDAAKTE